MFDTTNMASFAENHKPVDSDVAREAARCETIAWAASQRLKANESAVLVQLARGLVRREIAAQLYLTERQVATTLDRLAVAGLVIKTKAPRAGRGRPGNAYAVNFGSPLSEDNFQNSNCGSQLQETDFQKSDLRKVASGNPLPEITSKNPEPVDNPEGAYIGTGARADKLNLNTSTKIRSDQIASKDMIGDLIDRAGGACDPTAPGVHHGADLNRLLRAGCDWQLDIEPAVDKLAASFSRRGKRFSTWSLLEEHALDFRDRRLAGLRAPAPVKPGAPRQPVRPQAGNGGYGANGIRPLVAVA